MPVKLLVLLCFITEIYYSYGVDYEYYYLRSEPVLSSECTAKNNLKCEQLCGYKGQCIKNECYCSLLKPAENAAKVLLNKLSKKRQDKGSFADFQDHNGAPEQHRRRNSNVPTIKLPNYLDLSLLESNTPALRHHIAHFCPDLDIARTCIRTCMKEGKPAFCGKDHVCYCGHKYSNKDVNSKVDAEDVYSQFRDLYEKYFGPNYKQLLEEE